MKFDIKEALRSRAEAQTRIRKWVQKSNSKDHDKTEGLSGYTAIPVTRKNSGNLGGIIGI